MDRAQILHHLRSPSASSHTAVTALLADPIRAAQDFAPLLSSFVALRGPADQDDLLVLFFALSVFEALTGHFHLLSSTQKLGANSLLFDLLRVASSSSLVSFQQTPSTTTTTTTQFPEFVVNKLYKVCAKSAKCLYLERVWNVFDETRHWPLANKLSLFMELALVDSGGGHAIHSSGSISAGSNGPNTRSVGGTRVCGSIDEWTSVARECLGALGLHPQRLERLVGSHANNDSYLISPALGVSPSRSFHQLPSTPASSPIFSPTDSSCIPIVVIPPEIRTAYNTPYLISTIRLLGSLLNSTQNGPLSTQHDIVVAFAQVVRVYATTPFAASPLERDQLNTTTTTTADTEEQGESLLMNECIAQLSELAGRSHVPVAFAPPFLEAVGGAIVDALRLGARGRGAPGRNALEDFVVTSPTANLFVSPPSSGLTHLAHTFLKTHLKRVEQVSASSAAATGLGNSAVVVFPLEEFLRLWFSATFETFDGNDDGDTEEVDGDDDSDGYLERLGVWEAFVDFLAVRSGEGVEVDGYRDGLVSVYGAILDRLLWSSGKRHKRHNSNVDEWEAFVGTCLGVVAKISDLYPYQIIQHAIPAFFASTGRIRGGGGGGQFLDSAASADVCTLSRLVGQLAHFFVELGNFEENVVATRPLLENLVDTLSFALQASPPQTGANHQQQALLNQRGIATLQELNQLRCSLYSALRLYIHYLEKYSFLSTTKPAQHAQDFTRLLDAILSLCVRPLVEESPAATNNNNNGNDSQEQQQVSVPAHACRLLASVAETVRPRLTDFSAMRPLFADAHGIARRCGRDVKVGVYKVATLAIVVGGGGGAGATGKVSDEEWQMRQARLSEFYAPLIAAFDDLWDPTTRNTHLIVDARGDPHARAEVKHLVESFVGCMESVSAEGASAKNVVYLAVKGIVGRVLRLFEVYVEDADMLLDLFDFTHALQVTLRRQSARENSGLVIETLQLFMKLVESKGLLQLAISSSSRSEVSPVSNSLKIGRRRQPSNLDLLEKFLHFLTAVVQDTSKSIEGLLDHVVAFCQYSYPFIAHEEASNESLKLHFYDLLFVLLTFHQRHFFGSAVNRAASLHEREVASMIEMIANSFSDPNMEVFRHNLTGLETLNSKCALYQKELFQKHMMKPFIDLFLGILIARGHEFMKEEIAAVLGKIMTCNIPYFVHEYVPHFMSKYCTGIHSQIQVKIYSIIVSIQNTSNVTETIYSLTTELIYLQG